MSNASTEILFGTLDKAHTSTLSGYWVNYPTPWPYLLISLAISIGLGWLGYRSSAKSWHPVPKRSRRRKALVQSDMEMPTPHKDDPLPLGSNLEPQAYMAKEDNVLDHDDAARLERANLLTEKIRHAIFGNKNDELVADNTAESQPFDPAFDIRPDGGVGKFTMYKAIFGIAWTSLRAISIFALTIKIALGSDSSSAAYPDPLSVIILFTSAQTYLAGRGMPRLFNTVLAWDLVLIWIAFILCSFGKGSTSRYYGKIGIQGGDCPYFDRPKYLSGQQCAYTRWTEVGCATNSTWDINEHDFPRAAWWFTGNADPNTYGNSLLTFQLDFKLIGIAYTTFILAFTTLPMFFLPFCPRLLLLPLPAQKIPFLRSLARTTSLLAFALVCILAVIAIPLHVSAQLQPPTFPYVDSRGPLINASVFETEFAHGNGNNFGTGGTVPRGSVPTLAWNQSHTPITGVVGTGGGYFLGGNETSWSDCFWVQPPKSTTGHLGAWWGVVEGRVLRVLSGV